MENTNVKSKLAQKFVLSTLVISALSACDFIQTTGVTETQTPTTGTSTDGSSTTPSTDFTVVHDQNANPPAQGDNNTQPPAQPAPPDMIFEEGFSINNDAARTASPVVELQLRTLSPFKVKIGYAMDCSDGVWETYAEAMGWQLRTLNAVSTVTVKFQDWEGGLSPCYRKSIIHDSEGPDILFQKYPQTALEEGTPIDISANVSDKLSKVTSVTCNLNGVQKSCFEGLNEIKMATLPIGSYRFTIEASDELNNKSSKSISWDVYSLTKKIASGLFLINFSAKCLLLLKSYPLSSANFSVDII